MFGLLVLVVVFFLLPGAQAFAEIVVSIDGTGTGTVGSNPGGIECSNTGGGALGPDCSEEFAFEEVKLQATPDGDSYFDHWTGDDPGPAILGFGTCNSGASNPCEMVDPEAYGFGTAHITATFKLLPDPPRVITGGSGPGSNKFLTRLEGTVNPEGAVVEDCHFEYGLTAEYGTSTPCIPGASELGEGSDDEPVHGEAELEQLKPNTTYHYRVVASNLGGTGGGGDQEFTTGPAPEDHCPNANLRDTQVFGAIMLPDCMALEMVSPPQKGGQPARQPIISSDSRRVRFISVAALGGTPGGLEAVGDPYVATREESGWTIAPTSPPVEIVGGWSNSARALSFTPDFSRWFQIGATQTQIQLGVGRAFQAGLGGLFSPISPLFGPQSGGERGDMTHSELRGASGDHSHLYFVPGRTVVAYLPGDPEPSGGVAGNNTYVAHLDAEGQPSLELLARDRTGKVWGGNCGARLGGVRSIFEVSFSEAADARNQGAISVDGGRVYFSTRPAQPQTGSCNGVANKLRVLERLESKQGPWIGELFSSECNRAAPVCSGIDGDDYYQGASLDGTSVYFTTTRQLADSDLDTGSACNATIGESVGCDLYLYDSTLPPGQRLIQVSAGETSGEHPVVGSGANVLNGVTGISNDGSHVYFVAQGVLTSDGNPEGAVAQIGLPNLYVWDRSTEATSFVGTLAPGDIQDLWGGSGVLPVPELGPNVNGEEVGGDGHALPFVSRAALTADDSDGTRRDAFIYNANTDELVRVSKAAPGGSDNGPFDLSSENTSSATNHPSLGTDFAEVGRGVSENAGTAGFITAESLVPGDINGAPDRYLRRDGRLYRLPGVVDPLTVDISLSHDGSTVAFPSITPLLPQDGDTSADIYAVRVGGGFPEPSKPREPCQPDQSLAGEPCQQNEGDPNVRTAASATAPSQGNVKPKRCRKGKVRRHGRCVRPKKHHTRRAGHNGGVSR